MLTTTTELTPQQEKFIELNYNHSTQQEIAASLGIRREKVNRFMAEKGLSRTIYATRKIEKQAVPAGCFDIDQYQKMYKY